MRALSYDTNNKHNTTLGELQENGTFLNDDSEITVTEVVASPT